MTKVNDLGKSVLGELPKGEGSARDGAMPVEEMSHDMAMDGAGGGSMGAVISETPELGLSAYQSTIPDGKVPIRR